MFYDQTFICYIGATVRNGSEDGWSTVSPDLPYLYKATYDPGIEVPVDPPFDVWQKYGIVRYSILGGFGAMSFANMVELNGAEKMMTVLKSSRQSYLEGADIMVEVALIQKAVM